MEHFIIGIAGGSGCGKSTLSYRLKDRYPELIEVVHFDDYQKEETEIPVFKDMRNWDHPDAIDFKKLRTDITNLINNKHVEVMTKSSILNPAYEKSGRIQHILKPKKIIMVEGYLALHDKNIRDLFSLKIFLDIPIKESMKRRDKVTYNDESEYNDKILIPMHSKYVAPAKQIADLSIDVIKNNKEKVFDIVHKRLSELDLLPVDC
ncbi:MAG: deoxynucleoside kinase [Candidatus Aenigmarchaeota archaeon]|nr:deoxynucleoside kinase [Candidatus Aenigmarchaeota archaeon]